MSFDVEILNRNYFLMEPKICVASYSFYIKGYIVLLPILCKKLISRSTTFLLVGWILLVCVLDQRKC